MFFIFIILILLLSICVYVFIHIIISSKTCYKDIIYIGLTSTPDRLSFIFPTIKSLLEQTYKNIQIIISIPKVSRKNKKYVIPKFLSKNNNPKIILYRPDCDYGPGTKLLGTYEYLIKNNLIKNNTLILIFDDDLKYNKYMVNFLLKKYEENYTITSMFTTYNSGMYCLQGYSGVLIPTKNIDNSIFVLYDEIKDTNCVYADDYWLSYYFTKNECKIYQAGYTWWKPINLCFYLPTKNFFSGSQAKHKSSSNDNNYEYCKGLLI